MVGSTRPIVCIPFFFLLANLKEKKTTFFSSARLAGEHKLFIFFLFFLYLDDAAQSTYVVERERGYGKLTLAFISVSF